jgi:hypothetical protein
MKHLQLFEEFFYSDKTKQLQSQVELNKKKMADLKKSAGENPFHDNHGSLKKEYKEAEKNVAKFDSLFAKSAKKDLDTIGKKPFKFKTEADRKDSIENLFYALGYTEEHRQDSWGAGKFSLDSSEFDGHKYTMSLRIPKDYTNIYITINKAGEVFTLKGPGRFGSIPDQGTYWQYGTSGMNNPAATSEWPTEQHKFKTIGQLAAWLKELKHKAGGRGRAEAAFYANRGPTSGTID